MATTMFKVRRTFTFSDKAHSRSKTQMCLKKIIDFISSSQEENFKTNQISSDDEKESKARDLVTKKRGISIDLNLRLGLLSESENLTVNNKGFSACSGVGDGKVCEIISNIDCNSSSVDKSSEGECDPKESVEGFPEIEEERREISEITNLPEMETERVGDESEDGEQSEIKAEEEEEDEEAEVVEIDERENERVEEEEEEEEEGNLKCKKEGYLDLLVEAARLISGNFEDDDEEGKGRRTLKIIETRSNKTIVGGGGSKRRNQSWMLDFYEGFEDISPVVRSKRGRNQVLPYRYRDSVLDPWKRFSKQRSSSRVSNKNKDLAS